MGNLKMLVFVPFFYHTNLWHLVFHYPVYVYMWVSVVEKEDSEIAPIKGAQCRKEGW